MFADVPSPATVILTLLALYAVWIALTAHKQYSASHWGSPLLLAAIDGFCRFCGGLADDFAKYSQRIHMDAAALRSGGTIDLGPASGRENLGGTLGRLGQERPGTGQPGAVDEMLSPGRKTGG